jgi:hypothetical protein
MRPLPMRVPDLLAVLLLVLAGVVSGLSATGARRPAPLPSELDLVTAPFRLERPNGNPFLVTPQKWLELPMLRADFDLLADLELGEGAELDVLLRRVEPRPLHGMNLLFHGRFAVLRLSALADGPPWRTPADALLGPAGGVKLLPGSHATVTIHARGRALQANVAGRTLPEFLAQDDHGGLVFCVRGGTAALHSLQITPVQGGIGLLPFYVGSLTALLLAALARATGARPAAVCAAAVLLAGTAELGRRVAFTALPPLAQPEPSDELCIVGAGVPLALAVLLRGRAAAIGSVLGLCAAGWLTATTARDVAARFPPAPALDALLGEKSRETAAELLARRVRGPLSIHTPEASPHRVFQLGGQLLYQRGAAPEQHVEPLLQGELRATAKDTEVVTLPTEDGWSGQQWRMFDGFLWVYRPRVVVLGITRDEAAADAATGRPRSSPPELAATIAAARTRCTAEGATLVLLADVGVPADLMAVLREAHGEGVPLVELTDSDAATGMAHKLAAAVAPALQ